MPEGAWDCHVHVFGPHERYALSAQRRYTPGAASRSDLEAMLDRMGIGHAVLVQPTPYGDDHRCLADALEAFGGRCAGVACFDPTRPPPDRELERLAAAGVRALRLHLLDGPGSDFTDRTREAAALARAYRWHVELHATAEAFGLVAGIAAATGGPVVLDHLAYARPADAGELTVLLRSEPVFVKLSAPYRYEDAAAATLLARTLLERVPDRCLWASDWPHTRAAAPPDRLRPVPFREEDAGRLYDLVFAGADADTIALATREVPRGIYGEQDRPTV
ncbi:amidohydrolase family protein [Acuticoccus sp.]|uniref:amidohydrolase family protein n=1 Tax=Acuticoccus sp. TaxID=1904378 RepID=UPI003B518E52